MNKSVGIALGVCVALVLWMASGMYMEDRAESSDDLANDDSSSICNR